MGYDNFGLKIGVEGEKEFKNSLRDINQSFKVLGSEMNLVSSQFDKQDKSVQAVTARNAVLNKEIDSQKDKVSTLDKALQNASTSFGENDKRTKAWAVQLNNAKAQLNGMEKELGQNNQALDGTGKEFDNSEKQANQFGDEVKNTAAKTDDAGNKFQKLGSVLKGIGAAMATGVVAIGAAAGAAGKSLADMSVSSAAYADDILTQASATHMSTDSLQAYKYAAELVDVPMETLTTSMSKQVKAMSGARDGSAKFEAAYSKLGVSVSDSNGKLRDSDTVYWETIDALGKISNETERDALSMQIFGKSAQDLNPLIDQGSAGIAKLTEEAKKMGAVMSTDTLTALGKFDDSIQRLKSSTAAAKNVLGTVFLPELQLLADNGVALIGGFTKGIADAGGDWTKISAVIGETVGSLTSMLMASLPGLIQVGLDIVTSIGGAIITNLPLIIDSAVQIVMTLLQALIAALPQITAGALQLVMALVNGIIANLPALVKGALQMVITLATGIGNALPKLIPAVVDAVILIVNTLINNMDKVLAAAFKIIEGLARGLLNALPKLIDALPKIIDSIINFIVNNLPLIIELGIRIVVELAVGLIRAIPQLISKIPQIITSIVTGFAKYYSNMGQVGVHIVEGLWEGIKGMGRWIQNKVSDFFGGIVDSVKGMLGIHSPSTVFAGIGDNMAQGLGLGFGKAMDQVSGDIQSAIPTDFDVNTNVNVGTAGRSSGFSPQGNGFMLHIENFVNNTEKDIEQLACEFEFYRQRASLARGNA